MSLSIKDIKKTKPLNFGHLENHRANKPLKPLNETRKPTKARNEAKKGKIKEIEVKPDRKYWDPLMIRVKKYLGLSEEDIEIRIREAENLDELYWELMIKTAKVKITQ